MWSCLCLTKKWHLFPLLWILLAGHMTLLKPTKRGRHDATWHPELGCVTSTWLPCSVESTCRKSDCLVISIYRKTHVDVLGDIPAELPVTPATMCCGISEIQPSGVFRCPKPKSCLTAAPLMSWERVQKIWNKCVRAQLLQLCLTLCICVDCSPSGSSDFPGKNTVGVWHALLQGIFPTQGSTWCFPVCPVLQWILYPPSNLGSWE